MAAGLGKPFKPWQQWVSDVSLEVDSGGMFVYDTVVLVVMRQQGKSEWMLPRLAWRGMAYPMSRQLYTTLTATDAAVRWRDIHLERLKRSPFATLFTARLRKNEEAVQWANGSIYSPGNADGKASGTGDTLDDGAIDEAWSRPDNSTELGMRPAMDTRVMVEPGPQLLVASMVPGPSRLARAKMVDGSPYLRNLIRAGKARATSGHNSGTAFFMFAARPGQDRADPDTWWGCMPALGHLTTQARIQSAYDAFAAQGKLGDFDAEYLSLWPDESEPTWLTVAEVDWRVLKDPAAKVREPLTLAVSVNPAQTRASIVGVCDHADTTPAGQRAVTVELVRRDEGLTWVPDHLVNVCARRRVASIVVHAQGPAGVLVDDIKAAFKNADLDEPVTLRFPTATEYIQACGQFLAGTRPESRLWRHRGQPSMDRAVGAGQQTERGPVWVWTRDRDSNVDIEPLVAATLAAWGHRTRGEEMEPWVFFG